MVIINGFFHIFLNNFVRVGRYIIYKIYVCQTYLCSGRLENLIHIYPIRLKHAGNILLKRCNEVILYREKVEYEPSRMEPLSVESILLGDFPVHGLISIYFVANDRMTYISHMDTDLMSPSRKEFDFEERILVINMCKECELSPSELGIDGIFGCHSLVISRIPSDI